MTRTLATSPDGQWAAARDGRDLFLFTADPGPPVAKLVLESDDVDVAMVGPPTALAVVERSADRARILLAHPPNLEVVARLDLDLPATLAAVTGPRLALLSPDQKNLAVVRTATRALQLQKLDVTGTIEFVVGLERNQLLLGLYKKLEVWDAVSGRPLLRPQFQLPPPPRLLGTAAGHMWAILKGHDEVFVYRLSDGRPFRHHAGAAVTEVISNPASPILVLVTSKGLIRLHCFSHSMTPIEGVPDPHGALAQIASGDDISIVGYTGEGGPWRVAINGAGAVGSGDSAAINVDVPSRPHVKPDRPRLGAAATAAAAATTSTPAAPTKSLPAQPARLDLSRSEAKVSTLVADTSWRESLATYGAELARNSDPEPPALSTDTEIGELAERFHLGNAARRALVALYSLYLVGERAALARLATIAGDWSEALGQGQLGALAFLKKKDGRVALRTAVTDFLDATPPRNVRVVGEANGSSSPRAGAFRVPRDGRSDADIEAALIAQLGRIAIVDGKIEPALLEAHLWGATAVTMTIPPLRPTRWPKDAALVLVLYGTASSWVADVPALSPPPPPAS